MEQGSLPCESTNLGFFSDRLRHFKQTRYHVIWKYDILWMVYRVAKGSRLLICRRNPSWVRIPHHPPFYGLVAQRQSSGLLIRGSRFQNSPSLPISWNCNQMVDGTGLLIQREKSPLQVRILSVPPIKYGSEAHVDEHLTFNQGAVGSNPTTSTN